MSMSRVFAAAVHFALRLFPSGSSRSTARMRCALVTLVAVLGFTAVADARAAVLRVVFDDPVGDAPAGSADITRVELTFDTVSGAYLVRLAATAAQPFPAGFYRINLNTFNLDAPSGFGQFNDNVNDHPTDRGCLPPSFPFKVVAGSREYILSGFSNVLRSWKAGDRVTTSDPGGAMTGTGGFSSAAAGDLIADISTIGPGPEYVLFPLVQGSIPGATFLQGAAFQDLLVPGVGGGLIRLVRAPLIHTEPAGRAEFDRTFITGSERLQVAGRTSIRGAALGAQSSLTLSNGRPAIYISTACDAVVHRIRALGGPDFDGVAHLFLKFRVHGVNTENRADASARFVVGTHPFNMTTFDFNTQSVDRTVVVPFGKISVFSPFNAFFALVTSATVSHVTGATANASASADFLSTATLEEIRLTLDAEGTQRIPFDGFTSDTGLVIKVVNGVGVPLVGDSVAIDVRPGDPDNTINPKSKGKIAVAILAGADFDPLREIDMNSLKFGATGDERSLAFCNRRGEDVNRDGKADLVCHFETEDTGVNVGTEVLILTGKRLDGSTFNASQQVTVAGRTKHRRDRHDSHDGHGNHHGHDKDDGHDKHGHHDTHRR